MSIGHRCCALAAHVAQRIRRMLAGQRPARGVALAGLLAAALAAGCSDAGDRTMPTPPESSGDHAPEPAPQFEPRPLLPPPPAPAPGAFALEAELVDRPVELRLADRIGTVWIDREFGRLELGPEEQRRFTSGWYRVRAGKEGAPAAVAAKGRASVVEIPIAQVADRRLELDLAPLDAPDKLPNQVVRIVWNGVDLGRRVLDFGEQTLSVEVPARIQQIGLNRLRLEPLYWASAASMGVSFDDRPTSFVLNGLRLVGGSEAASSRPVGVRVEGEREAERVVQEPGAIVAWYLLVPDDAKLRATLGRQGASTPTNGRIRVALSLDSGEQVPLADHALAELASGDGVALDVDLARFAGRLAGIQATVSDDAAGAVVWESARIEGVQRERAVDASTLRGDYDVLVLLFDTLRADALSPYGNDVTRTPYLKALADSGFTFTQAGSNASWTRPSVASLWTGMHPWAHRVTSSVAKLPTAAPYLPAILSDAGWVTVGVTNNAHFSTGFGFGRGFDRFDEYYGEREHVLVDYPSPEAQAAQLWGRFLAPAFEAKPVAGREPTPVLAVVHEIDPHSPYQAPEPYASLYDFGYEGNIDGWIGIGLHQSMRMLDVVNARDSWLGEADRRAMRAAYMAEVSFVDAYVGALLGHLEATGRRDRTLVVFLSDHGEQLFEHGAWGHGRSLYQEEMAVPLIFSLPGVIPAGLSSSRPVELVDVAPTILDLLGLERPEGMQGRSLLPDMLAGPEASAAVSPQFATSNITILGRGTPLPSSVVWDSVRLGRWKLLRRVQRRLGVPRYEYELYDLERDPEEVLDLWGARPVVGHALKQMLEAKLERDARVELGTGSVDDIDPAVLENLRGLGYVE